MSTETEPGPEPGSEPGSEPEAATGTRAGPTTKAGRRRRLSAAQRRSSIDAAAQELALADGLQNVTHRSIAGLLGITHTLVVHHAADMGELRAHACEALLREEFETCEALAAPHTTAVMQLSVLIDALSRTGREDHSSVWLDGWSIGRRDPRMARTIRSAMDTWQEFIAAILIAGASRDEFSVDDPQGAAWEFIALLDGLNAHTLVAYGDPADYPARLAAPLAARLSLPAEALTSPTTAAGPRSPTHHEETP